MQSARRACGTWDFTRRDLFPVSRVPYEDPRTVVPDRDRAQENSHRPHQHPDCSPDYATPAAPPIARGPISRYALPPVGEWRGTSPIFRHRDRDRCPTATPATPVSRRYGTKPGWPEDLAGVILGTSTHEAHPINDGFRMTLRGRMTVRTDGYKDSSRKANS